VLRAGQLERGEAGWRTPIPRQPAAGNAAAPGPDRAGVRAGGSGMAVALAWFPASVCACGLCLRRP